MQQEEVDKSRFGLLATLVNVKVVFVKISVNIAVHLSTKAALFLSGFMFRVLYLYKQIIKKKK